MKQEPSAFSVLALPFKKKSTLIRLMDYTGQNKSALKKAFLLLLIATVTDISGPYLIKVLIDDYIAKKEWVWNIFFGFFIVYLIINMISAFAHYFQSVHLQGVAFKVIQKIREDVFHALIHFPLSYFDRAATGNLVSRIANDTENIKELYVSVLGNYVQNSFKILGAFIVMSLLDFRLMLVCLFFLPIIIGLMILYRRYSTPLFQRAREVLGEINGKLNESIGGMTTIQLFNQQRRFSEDFSALNEQHFQVRHKNLKLDALLLRPCVDMLHMFTLAAILFYFGQQGLIFSVQVGVIYAFVSYLSRFVEPIIEMTQRLNIFQHSFVSAVRVFDLLDEAQDTLLGGKMARKKHGEIHRGKLSFDNVTFGYQPAQIIIKQLSFSILPCEFIGIVGHTGSGKSTLLSLLLGFYVPNTGKITIDDCLLSELSSESLHASIVYIQQDPFIFSGTIFDNIALGNTCSYDQVIQAVTAVGLFDWLHSKPEGLNFLLKERGANLSAGQRQLIALARALVHQPRILLLDEVTSHIDSETEAVFQKALLALRGKMTLIVVAHRLSTIKKADRIWVMHQGEIKQEGTHFSLIAVDGLYQHLFQLQSQLNI